ncbi:hypothetical protein RRG08_062918 [Elysia crispata]|uniref:Uncharacterized protein n=1 Tax=Elysia crispata TaxID=231223 RepID=A0AAE1D4H6_9GAST|nr:hypothetical protein RRG08_062918 [Elysia crispata]
MQNQTPYMKAILNSPMPSLFVPNTPTASTIFAAPEMLAVQNTEDFWCWNDFDALSDNSTVSMNGSQLPTVFPIDTTIANGGYFFTSENPAVQDFTQTEIGTSVSMNKRHSKTTSPIFTMTDANSEAFVTSDEYSFL